MLKPYIVKGIKFLINLGLFKKVVEIEYKGQGVSLNKFYSQGHWSTRNNIKNKYKKIFRTLFLQSKDLQWMNRYSLIIFFNSRHDTDNVVGMCKVFMDSLKQEIVDDEVVYKGYVFDDNKKYFRGLFIVPDESLPNNTFQYYLIEHGN